MFTRCPECHHTQTLTVEQLRVSGGMIRCENCSTPFDALKRLSESPTDSAPITQEEPALPWIQQDTAASTKLWGSIATAALLLLCAQILYFKGPEAPQNEKLRPWLIKACAYLACNVPSYRNPDDFSVLDSSLKSTADNHYFFKAIIHNQSEFSQPHPGVKLTLLKLSGEAFSQRSFSANQLTFRTDEIAPQETFEISLVIAVPNITVGGYTFEII